MRALRGLRRLMSMDMTDPGFAFPKSRPRVLDRIEKKQQAGVIERACRKAVDARDGRWCRYPLCDEKAAHKHHIVKRSQLGTWRLSNILSLCAFHHALIHAGTVGVTGEADRPIWTGPARYARKARA